MEHDPTGGQRPEPSGPTIENGGSEMESVAPETLEAYLPAHLGADSVTVEDVVQHSEGWSRNTFSFTAIWEAEGAEHTRRFALRAKSEGGVLDTDLKKEFRVMDAVQDTGVPVPETHWFESDESIVGAPFFIVDHVDGEAPNTWRGSERETLEAAWEDGRDLPEQFVDAATAIHSVSPGAVPFLDRPDPDEVVEREIDRWASKYDEFNLRNEPVIDEAIRWFRDNPPVIEELTLVHGDFRIGNMLIEEGDITAVLDWEMARICDPHYDLGYSSMPYLAGKLIDRPTDLVCALLERDWYYDRYEEVTGRPVNRYAVRYWEAFGIFVMITILLTGVDRYNKGKSDDVRQVWLQYPVPGLLEDMLSIMREYGERA